MGFEMIVSNAGPLANTSCQDKQVKTILIKSVREHEISKEEALEKLATFMWLRIDVYEGARKAIVGLK